MKNQQVNIPISTIILVTIIFTLLIIAAVIITFIIVKHKDEKRIGDFQDRILKKQRDEVQNVYQTMRAWRHDYHNHMQSIKALLAMNQIAELEKYLDSLEEDLDSIDIAIKTGNIGLDAILSSKVSIARKNQIDVNCKATVPKDLEISDVHLCAIVGNLLDNAIESCEKIKSDSKILPFIRIYIGIFKKQLYISITNSTTETKRKKISEFITSKKGDHGLGLKRVDKLVAKYDGFVNRKNEPGVFSTEIMLPMLSQDKVK